MTENTSWKKWSTGRWILFGIYCIWNPL